MRESHLCERINADRAAWLGEGGLVAADGGVGGATRGDFFLQPFPKTRRGLTDAQDQFNFRQSSTRYYYERVSDCTCHEWHRFFIEELFGRWKVRPCVRSLSRRVC